MVETSPLAEVVPAGDGQSEADLGTVISGTTDASGNLSASFAIPATWSASDTNAACPPTQAQMNAGLTNCGVDIATSSGVAYNVATLIYEVQPTPAVPDLNLSAPSGLASDVLHVSGSGWWGNAVGGAPNSSEGVSLTAAIGGVATTDTLAVSPATYTGSGSPGAGWTLTPPAISGTITVPAGGNNAGAVVQETNLTAAPGNGDLNSTIGTNNVSSAGPSPVTGGTAGAHAIDNGIPASNLKVTPRIAGAPNGGLTAEVNAGAAAQAFNTSDTNSPFGDSTGIPVLMASAATGGGGGAFLLDGSLALTVPGYVSQGTYTATLDLVIS